MVWNAQIRWKTIVLYYVYGFDADRVSELIGPSRRSIAKWFKKFELDGTVDAFTMAQVAKSGWSSEVLEFLRFYISMDPIFLIGDLVKRMQDQSPSVESFSERTICRALRHDLNLTRKDIQKISQENVIGETVAYLEMLRPFYMCPEQLVFVDETWKYSRNSDQSYWMNSREEICPDNNTYPYFKGNRISVLAALDCTGFFAFKTAKGVFDRAAYLSALLEKVVPLLNPYPFPRSILVLDHSKIHLYDDIVKAVHGVGSFVFFSLPNPVQLNPIDIGFRLLERWINSNADLVWGLGHDITLDVALKNCLSECRSTVFFDCGYRGCKQLIPSIILGSEYSNC